MGSSMYLYKEEYHPQRMNECRLLVTWPGYGWWHMLGSVVSYDAKCAEVWPAYGLHRDVSRLFAGREEAIKWLKELWSRRRGRR